MNVLKWWTVLVGIVGEVIVIYVANSFQTSTQDLLWPEGLYGLPKSIDGCPATTSVTWESGVVFQDCEDTNPKTSKSPSYHLAGFVTNDVQKEFCIKTSTKDDMIRPPWPLGQYCIYQKGNSCPPGLESGWVIWDDESELVGGNKNKHNGTLPKGIYDTNTKMYFCCSTKGDKQVAINLPVASPFYLIAYGSSVCQSVRGASVSREFIYYETEYYTIVTKNDYGGAHPYRVTRTRYGHTIYYCYYTPNYCPPIVSPLNGELYPAACTRTNQNTLNSSCTVHCNHGYIPKTLNTTTTVCGEDGTWDLDVLSECIPIEITPTNTLKNASTTAKNKSTLTDSMENSLTTPHIPHTSLKNSETKQPTPSKAWEVSTMQEHVLKTQAVSKEKSSSTGRIIAGSICGGVLFLGLIIACILHLRKDRTNKTSKKSGLIDRSKSLEELVAGSFSYEVQYSTLKADNNPLYQCIESVPTDLPERMTDNLLYESVSPLISDGTVGLDKTNPQRSNHATL